MVDTQPISDSDYRWLLRRVSDDLRILKWPVLYRGDWITLEQTLDLLRQYESRDIDNGGMKYRRVGE
jgi:hypothetical protein